MPTGLTNSPGIIGGESLSKPAPTQPRGAINQWQRVIFAVSGVPQVAQPVFVPPNCLVYIRAHNGTLAGNQHVCRVATNPQALSGGIAGTGGNAITPDTEINFPVDNHGQIWAVGTALDGIIISNRANAT